MMIDIAFDVPVPGEGTTLTRLHDRLAAAAEPAGALDVAYRTIDTRFMKLVFFDPRLVVIGILSGAIIGIVGSATSVWSHLRRI